jgi:rod shape-determining protein MreC
MAGKRIRISSKMLFAWFMLGGFILLFSPLGITSKFQFAFARLFRWPLSAGRQMPLSAKTELPLKDDASQKESQYQNYIANLEAELAQKNQTIQQLSGMRTRSRDLEGAKLVPADIIISSVTGLRSELIINRGKDDGLTKDMFVIGNNSVIGTISEMSARTAKVRLFTDAESTVQVNIPKVEINMLMQGAGNNSAKIKMVPVKHEIKIGEPVMLRKKPGFLDSAMVIGEVRECKRDNKNPSLWDITIKPRCDITKLNNVAVIIMNPQNSGNLSRAETPKPSGGGK